MAISDDMKAMAATHGDGYRRGRADENERCLAILKELRLRAVEYRQGCEVTLWIDAAVERIAWPAMEG